MRINSIHPIFTTYKQVQKNTKENSAPCFAVQNNLEISNFYYLPLNFKGIQGDFKKELEGKFLDGDQDELFLFLDESFKKRAEEKGIKPKIIDDVVQNSILDVLILLQEFEENDNKTQEQLFDEIENVYLNLKPKKQDYVTDIRTSSLDKKVGKKEKPLLESLTEENKLKPLSHANEEEREKQRKKVTSAISDADLTKREKEVLNTRYSEDNLVTYQKIGKIKRISVSRIFQILKGAILKIQISNGTIPNNIQEYIDDFSKTFGIEKETTKKILIKKYDIVHKTPKERKENIKVLVDRFKDEGLTTEDYIKACIKQPQLFCQSPDTIEKNVKDVVETFKNNGLTTEDYIKACIKQPQLFCQSPDTIEKKPRELVERFKDEGLKTEDYIKACIKQPQLFCQSPDTIENNIRDLIKRFEQEGLTTEGYIKCCVKCPSLFSQSPDTIEKNVRTLVDIFKDNSITTEEYIKSCLKQPTLFYQSPDTIEKNVRDVIKRFENEGLTTEDYIKCCIKQPQLFYQLPDTIENNVRNVIERFEDEGLIAKDYIKCCIKQSSLFSLSPDTIENNVKELVYRFKKEGLTTEDYIKCCIKQPQLFYQSPNTIEKNVRNLVDRFKDEGLIAKDYIKCCIKSPQLFYQSPDTISEHIDILRFCNLNSKDPLSNEEFWAERLKYPLDYSNSSSLILIKKLIIPKMFENSKIPKELKGSKQREKLNEYLKNHPNKSYVLNIKNLECDTDCIKILKETLYQITSVTGVKEDIFTVEI